MKAFTIIENDVIAHQSTLIRCLGIVCAVLFASLLAVLASCFFLWPSSASYYTLTAQLETCTKAQDAARMEIAKLSHPVIDCRMQGRDFICTRFSDGAIMSISRSPQ